MKWHWVKLKQYIKQHENFPPHPLYVLLLLLSKGLIVYFALVPLCGEHHSCPIPVQARWHVYIVKYNGDKYSKIEADNVSSLYVQN